MPISDVIGTLRELSGFQRIQFPVYKKGRRGGGFPCLQGKYREFFEITLIWRYWRAEKPKASAGLGAISLVPGTGKLETAIREGGGPEQRSFGCDEGIEGPAGGGGTWGQFWQPRRWCCSRRHHRSPVRSGLWLWRLQAGRRAWWPCGPDLFQNIALQAVRLSRNTRKLLKSLMF